MYRVLLIAVVLIAYGSLWPWQYNPAHLAGNPILILLHSWPARIDATDIPDIAVNLLLYIPIGMFGYLALDRLPQQPLLRIVPILFGFVFSCSIEMVQIFDQARHCGLLDVCCNTVSAGLGVALGIVFRKALLVSLTRPRTAASGHASGPLMLLYFWIGVLTIPLFPLTAHIGPKLRLLSIDRFSIVECVATFVAWLIAAHLLESAYGFKPGWVILLMLSLLAPAKIFIAQRVTTISELAGLAAALLLYRSGGTGKRLLAVLTLGVITMRGLAPFHFTGGSHFIWMPFVALLQSEWENGLIVLCDKCFWYGSAIWLLWTTGRRLFTATALVTALLAAIEILQLRLPGRTAESTDPLMAILLGTVLWLVETHGRHASVDVTVPDLVGVDR